jgi:phosphoglycolate phosphatase-like HAD superfamily hydrolase
VTSSFDGYKRLTLNGNPASLRVSSMDALRLTDVVIFDCDGVLIDSRESYDRAIEATVAYFLSTFMGLKLNLTFPTQQLVETLRGTGQYNNDIDAAAAILVSIAASLPSDGVAKRLRSQSEAVEGLQETLDSEAFVRRASSLLDLASQGFRLFVKAVKAEFRDSAPCVDDLLERLAYPGGPASSPLSRVFDEYYYGPTLLKQLHGLAPIVGCKTGLIESEKALVSPETLRSLSSLLPKGRMGIVSGRSRLGTERTLGELMKFFQDGPLVFLEDHDAYINATHPIPGKPSPESLLLAIEHAENSRAILYVGDSAEDLMMTSNARLVRPNLAFCGVVGAAYSTRRDSMLSERGADAIIKSVNDLPALLSSVR